MTSKLPAIEGAAEIPVPFQSPGRCAARVGVRDGDVYEIGEAADAAAPSDSRAVFKASYETLDHAYFEPTPSPGPSNDTPDPALHQKVVRAARIMLQFLLMFLRLPTNIKALKHTSNADTKLVPAIDNILEYIGAIAEEDPRILKKVDVRVLSQQRDLLLRQRELLRMFKVVAQCLDAGTTHVEQYLDGSARYIYKKLLDELGEDRLMQSDFERLISLVAEPIVTGQETLKYKIKVSEQAEAKGEAKALEKLQKEAQPGAASGLPSPPPVTAPTPPASAPRTGKRTF